MTTAILSDARYLMMGRLESQPTYFSSDDSSLRNNREELHWKMAYQFLSTLVSVLAGCDRQAMRAEPPALHELTENAYDGVWPPAHVAGSVLSIVPCRG